MSKNLSIFRQEYLDANTWPQRKDGVPLELLDNLDPDELIVAEQELIAAAGLDDDWPIIGLGHIRSQKSLPMLYELLEKATGSYKVIIAHSIFQICSDTAMIGITLDELASARKWGRKRWSEYELINILYLLPDFQSAEINKRLVHYMEGRYYLTAYNAARALGLPTEPIVEKFQKKWYR